jgi:SAM-dependent methyltransferase
MEWFADETLWRELYPYMFPLERVAAAGNQVTGILNLTGITGGDLLDLCCGPGRHAVEFARRGFRVTGVDRSPYLLARAREKAAESAMGVEWVLGDMREFCRPAAFDLACNLFTSFGYFAREDDNLRVLRNLRKSLRDGGALIIDVVGRERVERQGLNTLETRFADGALLIQQPQVNADWSRMYLTWTLQRNGQSHSFQFEHDLYSGRELSDRLLSCGFNSVELFGDLEGSPYGPDATRLIAVARH